MEEIRLKEICDLENGYAFRSSDYVDYSNTLNCRMSNIRPDGSFNILYNAKFLPDSFVKKYKDYLLKDGDLIIAMTDMAGDPKILGVPTVVDTQGYNLLLNQRVGKLILFSNSINVEYLKLALQSCKVRNYFKRFAGGGLQLNVGKKDILNAPIIVRQEKEQLYIASVFKTINKLNNHYIEQLLLLDELIKSRFVEMFGDPVSNKKGWLAERMDIVAPSVNYDGIFDKKVWLLNLDMIEPQSGRIIDYCIINNNEVGISTCSFDSSNVLYSKLRPYLNKVVVPDRCGYATSELIPLKPDKTKLNRVYFAFMLRSDEFVKMISEKVAGAKMPRVSMGEFKKFNVPIPPIELQNQFADFVEQVEKQKATVKKSLEKLETLKKSLMQEFFG